MDYQNYQNIYNLQRYLCCVIFLIFTLFAFDVYLWREGFKSVNWRIHCLQLGVTNKEDYEYCIENYYDYYY